MNSLVVFAQIILLASIVTKTEAIKCYGCYSQSSAEDCWLNSGTYNCADDSVCYSAKHKMFGIELHYKGCTHKDSCNSYKICGADPDDINCSLKCCTDEKCNSSNIVKSFTLLSVAVTLLSSLY
eukprot:TCONS_00024368-protein